jgi:hypothetical protein
VYCVPIGIREMSRPRLSWGPRHKSSMVAYVDGLSIHIQPGADIKKDSLNLIRYSTLRPKTDVHERVTVLADDINQLMNQEFRRLNVSFLM